MALGILSTFGHGRRNVLWWWHGCWRAVSDFLWPHIARARKMEADARTLLYDNLSESERDQLRELGYFEVIGGATSKTYRIRNYYGMNVEEVSKGGARTRVLCFSPRGQVALGDIMLAQKLALELFEPEVLAVANVAPTEPLN